MIRTTSLLLGFALAACAQTPIAIATFVLPNGIVGAPYSAEIVSNAVGPTASWSNVGGCCLPPGISLSAAKGPIATISGTPTTAGTFGFSIAVSQTLPSGASQTVSETFSLTIAATAPPVPNNFAAFTITGTIPANAVGGLFGLRVNTECTCGLGYTDVVLESVSYSENGGSNMIQDPSFQTGIPWFNVEESHLVLGSESVEPAPNGGYQLHFNTTPGTVQVQNGFGFPVTAGAKYTASFLARVTPQSVGNGYFTLIFNSVVGGGGEVHRDTIDLQSTIFGLSPSQSGFTIQAVAGGGTPPPVTFSLLNGLQTSIDFTVTTTTTDGSPWLSATPGAGTATVAAGALPTAISVQANPGSLAAGTYYGQVVITAPKAPNSPQVVSIVLVVAPATATPPPDVGPVGLVFTAIVGGSNPAPQNVTVTDIAAKPQGIGVAASFSPMAALTTTPSSLTVAPNQPQQIQVSVNITGLAAGVYRGRLDLYVSSINANVYVDLLLVVAVAPPAAAPLTGTEVAHAAPATCTPTQLLPVFTLLGEYFSVSAAWPEAVGVKVVDDCGSPLTSGSVVVSFSNGDPPLPLFSLQNGEWTGTWAPAKPLAANLVVTSSAASPNHSLTGSAQITGAALSNPGVPVVTPGGVVSAASYSPSASPSPGEIISIFGSSLAAQPAGAADATLPMQLGGVTVVMGTQTLPLVSVSPAVINAVVPYNVTPGSTTQVIVSQGSNLSLPLSIPLAPAEPGIFTVDASGSGQGHIYVISTGLLANASNPAKPGDAVVIYCSGLGAVSPAVEAGSPTPSDTLRSTTAPALLTIGGVPAKVNFAGLTPTEIALYQVNAVIPPGVTPGNSVPVVLTVAGYGGAPVTMAIASQ